MFYASTRPRREGATKHPAFISPGRKRLVKGWWFNKLRDTSRGQRGPSTASTSLCLSRDTAEGQARGVTLTSSSGTPRHALRPLLVYEVSVLVL